LRAVTVFKKLTTSDIVNNFKPIHTLHTKFETVPAFSGMTAEGMSIKPPHHASYVYISGQNRKQDRSQANRL